MATTTFTKYLKIKLADGVQVLPIPDSHMYRRLSIEIKSLSAGNATVIGSLSGSKSRVSWLSLLDNAGVYDKSLTGDGYSEPLGADGLAIVAPLVQGLVTFELPTHMSGGLMLSFNAATAAPQDETTEVIVLMSGNATIPGAPRGA